MERTRRVALAAMLWLYGISTTAFLFSIWGRVVVVDSGLLASAATSASAAEMVSAHVQSWFGRELAVAGFGDAGAEAAVRIVALPEVAAATGTMAGELVQALAEPSAGLVAVDVAAIFDPAVPAITESLVTAGVPTDEAGVRAIVSDLDPLILRTSAGRALVGPGSGAARTLTVATVAALATMAASGATAVMGSEDRRLMARTLLNRLAVSALTFAVFFRVSAWVLDPRGGRASVGGALSQVVGSYLWVPLVVAGAAAAAGWLVHRRRAAGADPPVTP